MPSSSDPFRELGGVCWTTLPLRLRNTRHDFARQRTLSILDAVFKHGARTAGLSREDVFFFHPVAAALPLTVRRGDIYSLQVVFPGNGTEHAQQFLQGLQEHLRKSSSNFDMVEHDAARTRTLDDLQREFREAHGDEPHMPEELCLDFLTPLPFEPADPKRRWMISGQEFLKLLVNRVSRLFGLRCEGWEDAGRGMDILPYYWEYQEFRHPSKSGPGVQYVNGMCGPLYLRGELEPLLPLLLVCSEVHAGRRTAAAQGYYRLGTDRPFFDERLASSQAWLDSLQRFARESDRTDNAPNALLSLEEETAELQHLFFQRQLTCGPATAFPLPKKTGGQRIVASFDGRDLYLQKVLRDALAPIFERMFEHASIGFRKGKSRKTAAEMIRQALAEGYQWVLESDIADFYDSIDWTRLDNKLAQALPQADIATKSALTCCIRAGLTSDEGPVARERGVIQGSPLSPMLSNLYLDNLDEAVERAGYRLVRYADDFIILTRTREDAEAAQRLVLELLCAEGLCLKQEKTFISRIEAGFDFLGMEHGGEEWDRRTQPPALRKSLYVREPYAFVGLDGESLEVRKDGGTLGRVPFRKIRQLILMGNNSLSSKLIQKCASESIPLSLCTPSGQFIGAVMPREKTAYDRLAAHSRRHAALAEKQRLELAASLVDAKITNYAKWFRGRRDPESVSLAQRLTDCTKRLPGQSSIAAMRGLEGEAAKDAFVGLNRLVLVDAFKAENRTPRQKKDRLNSVLDFAYTLLFNRLNVLIRARGLNPFLGILHSDKDNYESLVCDLQEPFRHRVDRMLLTQINTRTLAPETITKNETGRFWPSTEATTLIIEAFEKELDTCLADESANLAQQLESQVAEVERWAAGHERLRFFVSDPQDAN